MQRWGIACVAVACGGAIVTYPIVADDGTVIEAEATYGANVCNGWDASGWYVPPPSCAGMGVGNPVCVAWANASFPMFAGGGCELASPDFEAGVCVRAFNIPLGSCDPDGGDEYCRSVVKPFVPGHVPAMICEHFSIGGPPAQWNACAGELGCNCPLDEICVVGEAGSVGFACVPPCIE